MENREKVKEILMSIMPIKISDLYVELIKLVYVYKNNCNQLYLQNCKQLELVSTIDYVKLKELKISLGEVVNRMSNFMSITPVEIDFNLLISEARQAIPIKKMLEVEEEKIKKWYFNEVRISELSNEIKLIVESIQLKLNEIYALDLDDNSRRIDKLHLGKRHVAAIDNMNGINYSQKSYLKKLFWAHLYMWKTSFVMSENAAVRIIEAYNKRELIDISEFHIDLIYYSVLFCNSKYCYSDILKALFPCFSETESISCNDANLAIVKAVPEFLVTGVLSDEVLDAINSDLKMDATYFGLLSHMKSGSVVRESTNVVSLIRK